MENRSPILATPKIILNASSWHWHQPAPAPCGWKSDMWIGTDSAGRQWLVKMRGPAAAAREHLFASLGRHLGIPCQCSEFLELAEDAEPVRAVPSVGRHQLAIQYEMEHPDAYCGWQCPLAKFDQDWKDSRTDKIEALLRSGMPDALGMVQGSLLGLLCGQKEPPGLLWTARHSLILIDHETMWTRKPRNPFHSFWARTTATGESIARQVCESVANLTPTTLESLAAAPEPFSQTMNSAKSLRTTQEAAVRYLAAYDQRRRSDGLAG